MEEKQRNGCVTAWLILMIIGNSISIISYLFLSENFSNLYPESAILVMAMIGFANLIFSIMLFKWKKWAFWAFVGSSTITLFVNILNGVGIIPSFLGLSGAAILYGILQIKENGKTAWENLD